jgi:hypothetical protein
MGQASADNASENKSKAHVQQPKDETGTALQMQMSSGAMDTYYVRDSLMTA